MSGENSDIVSNTTPKQQPNPQLQQIEGIPTPAEIEEFKRKHPVATQEAISEFKKKYPAVTDCDIQSYFQSN